MKEPLFSKEDLPMMKEDLRIRRNFLRKEKAIVILFIIVGLITIPLNLFYCYKTTFEPIDAFSITLLTCATYKMFTIYVEFILPKERKLQIFESVINNLENGRN